MVTLKQIAEKCGVSVASVSKALHNAPDISAATAERIRKTAQEMGYFPNAAARALKTHKSYNIGVLFEDETHCGLTHEYFTEVLNAVKNQAEAYGYDVTFISKNVGGHLGTFLEHCRYRNCDGVVIASVDFTDPQVVELVKSDIPVVTIDYTFDGNSAVLSDNVRGIRELMEYIYSQGHRKIACIHGENTAVTRTRITTFNRFCQERGLDIPEEYMMEGRFHDPKSSGLATRKLLSLENVPTCILYPDDISLMGGITEIERAGLKIPEDISVVGYDGIRLSRLLRPVITTLCQASEQLGKEAVRLLIEQIEHPKTAIPEFLVIAGKVQEGETVGRIETL